MSSEGDFHLMLRSPASNDKTYFKSFYNLCVMRMVRLELKRILVFFYVFRFDYRFDEVLLLGAVIAHDIIKFPPFC